MAVPISSTPSPSVIASGHRRGLPHGHPSSAGDRNFLLLLKSWGRRQAIDEGKQLHGILLKSGTPHAHDVYISTALLHLYARCGCMDDARALFDRMPTRSVVSWNVLIDGYLNAGDVSGAWEVFDGMPERNSVSWNTMICGLSKNRMPEEALKLFMEMTLVHKLVPDDGTMTSVLSAICKLELWFLARWAHAVIIRRCISLDGALGVVLVNMYGRCGDIDDAHRVFRSITCKNVEHWTAMVCAYAAHGCSDASLGVFKEMTRSGVDPNHVTFVGILNACSHAGLVDEGLRYFNLMKSYGIHPSMHHYGCLVDLLGRAGFLQEAMYLIETLPEKPGAVIWSSLLAACKSHGNIEMAEFAWRRLAEANHCHGSGYVMLSNMYASNGRWDDFTTTRRLMVEMGSSKVTGMSWIELDGDAHAFVARDKHHFRIRDIHCMLNDLKLNLQNAGYEDLTEFDEFHDNGREL